MCEADSYRTPKKGTTLFVEYDPAVWDLQVANLLALNPGRAGPMDVVVVASSTSKPSLLRKDWTIFDCSSQDGRQVLDAVETEFQCFIRSGVRLRWDALDAMAATLASYPELVGATGDSFLTDRSDQPFVGHIRCGILHRPPVAGASLFHSLAWEAPILLRTSSLTRLCEKVFDPSSPWAQRIACHAARSGLIRSSREFLFLEQIASGSGPSNSPDDPRLDSLLELGEADPATRSRLDDGVDIYAHLGEGPKGRWTNVLTVTFNRLEYTRETINALVETTAFPHGILVVDNASIDGTREYLLDLHRKGVVRKVMLLDRNVGLARGINLGWRHESSSSFLLKLDNDMVFQRRGWLEAIVGVSDRVPEVAVLGYSVESRSYPATEHGGIRLRVKVDGNVGGGCVFLSNATRDRFGFFCEDYGLYGEEDGDLGLRVRLEGFLNAYMDDEDAVFHLPSGKAGAIDPKTLKAIDSLEMKIDPQYRWWKDEQRANLQRNGGILQRNVLAYQSGQRSLWVPTGEFLGLLGDLQVFDDVDAWCITFHPRDGRVQHEHVEMVAGWASTQGLPSIPRCASGYGREWLVLGKFDSPVDGLPGVVVGREGILDEYSRNDEGMQTVEGIAQTTKTVSIVIPVHGNLDLTRQCVSSVQSTTDASRTEIVVVDDASPDDTTEWLRDQESNGRIKAVILPANKGFAGACNAGLAASTGDVLVFLNNDTICLPGWLDAMVEALKNPAVGLVGSRLIYEEGDIQHAGIRMLNNGFPVHEFRHAAADDPRVLVSRDRPFVTGACVALSRDLFAMVGGFDEGYHMYVEDLDLCLKIWDAGFRVRYVADSVVVHLECRTMKDPERRAALVNEGLRRLYDRWSNHWPEALHSLPDWPAHFRKGPSLRWAAPLFRKDGEEFNEIKIVEFLERHLHDLLILPVAPDPDEIERMMADEEAGGFWREIFHREDRPSILVVSGSLGETWNSAGRPSRHVCFVRDMKELSTHDDVACLRACSLVWACGPEVAEKLRSIIVEPGLILELPRLNQDEFAHALLLAVAKTRAQLPPTSLRAPIRPGPTNSAQSAKDHLSARVSVHWCAPILNHSDYAHINRNFVRSLHHDGIRLSVNPLESDQNFANSLSGNQKDLAFWKEVLKRPEERGGLLVHSQFPSDFPSQVEANPIFRAHVGLTMFETDRLPHGWARACEAMTEIWVPSTFNRETFERGGLDPQRIQVVPYGIDLKRWNPSTSPHEIPGRRKINLLAVFEWTILKGWDILVEAFARAFSPDDDVSLTVQTRLPKHDRTPIRAQIDAHLRSRGLDPFRTASILFLEESLPDAAMSSLYAACDAVVLPMRGEGCGFSIMEAMAMERPVVATAWGAHMDFFDDTVGWTIPVECVEPVHPAYTRQFPLYGSDHQWARPSLEAFVDILRSIPGNRGTMLAKGQAGRARLAADWTPERSARWIQRRAEFLL